MKHSPISCTIWKRTRKTYTPSPCIPFHRGGLTLTAAQRKCVAQANATSSWQAIQDIRLQGRLPRLHMKRAERLDRSTVSTTIHNRVPSSGRVTPAKSLSVFRGQVMLRYLRGVSSAVPAAAALIVVAVIGCGAPPRRTRSANRPLATDSVVIFGQTETRRFWPLLAQCDRADTADLAPGGTPTRSAVERADRVLRTSVDSLLRGLRSEDTLLPSYLIQYLGVLHNGRPALFANGVVRRLVPGEQEGSTTTHPIEELVRSRGATEPLIVCDGGMVRFYALVDTQGVMLRPVTFNPTVGGSLRK